MLGRLPPTFTACLSVGLPARSCRAGPRRPSQYRAHSLACCSNQHSRQCRCTAIGIVATTASCFERSQHVQAAVITAPCTWAARVIFTWADLPKSVMRPEPSGEACLRVFPPAPGRTPGKGTTAVQPSPGLQARTG